MDPPDSNADETFSHSDAGAHFALDSKTECWKSLEKPNFLISELFFTIVQS